MIIAACGVSAALVIIKAALSALSEDQMESYERRNIRADGGAVTAEIMTIK